MAHVLSGSLNSAPVLEPFAFGRSGFVRHSGCPTKINPVALTLTFPLLFPQVFCYALSVNDGSEWRQRILSEAEHFLDVSSTPSEQIAAQIAADQIQVLINLNGYTKGARNEIFALRPAPIQVSYMGFPGTTGAEYIDYLVTDEVRVASFRFLDCFGSLDWLCLV